MRLKILYLIVALFPIVTTAASIPTKNGTETVETSKNESMPIAKPKPNDTNSKNVSTQVSNPLEAKNDTVNATDKGASLKNVKTKLSTMILSRRESLRIGSHRGMGGIFDEDPSSCCTTKKCTSYYGGKHLTKSGKTCQRWDSQEPHKHSIRLSSSYNNHCFNPNLAATVWCYTTDPDKRWEYCAVRKCTKSDYDGQTDRHSDV